MIEHTKESDRCEHTRTRVVYEGWLWHIECQNCGLEGANMRSLDSAQRSWEYTVGIRK